MSSDIPFNGKYQIFILNLWEILSDIIPNRGEMLSDIYSKSGENIIKYLFQIWGKYYQMCI